MSIPRLKLPDGHTIPQIGLGTWRLKDPAELNGSFEAAVKAGYRHVDTAQAYGNEQFLGEAWRASGLSRDELFITTKIAVAHFGYHRARQTFEESLVNLQTDYVDLLLLHFPVTLLRQKTWKALEEIHAAGSAKSIGVSNYTIRHLEEMKEYAKLMPAVNQVELHVFLQQPELIEYCRQHDILVEAYSPLAHGQPMDDPVVAGIATEHGKTYAQVMLRWLVQQGLVVLPKSATPEKVRENLAIFDFELSNEDMKKIAALDRNLRTCWSPVHVP